MKKTFSHNGKRILKGTVQHKTLPGATMKTARQPIIILDPEAEYPPEMAKLTDNRKRFVIAAVMFPAKSNTELAILAGMGGTDQHSAIAGYKMMGDQTILAAVQAYSQFLFGMDAPLYREKLREYAKHKDPRVALKAIEIGLKYTGLAQSPMKHVHEHTVELTRDELRAELQELFRANPELQIEHQEVIVDGRDTATGEFIIDGEFTDLKEAA